MRWTVTRGGSTQDAPWHGGPGRFRTLLTKLSREGALLWRAGILDLGADTPVPRCPHYDHTLTPVVDDPGSLELELPDGRLEVCEPFAPASLPGEWPACLRVKRPIRAFLVVADRRQCRAEVRVLHLEAGDPVETPDAEEVLIHCLEGELSTAGDLIEAGDSLLGVGPAAPAAASTDALAILVAVRPAIPLAL